MRTSLSSVFGPRSTNLVTQGQMRHDNAAPKVRCAVFKREIDGKRAVVFDVAEFDETPTICTNTILSSDGAKRTILREGAVCARTERQQPRRYHLPTICGRSSHAESHGSAMNSSAQFAIY